jgi:hypothetical protein
MGETATVCGVVVSAEYEADVQSQPTLLDMGSPFSQCLVTAVIYGDHRAKFGTPNLALQRQPEDIKIVIQLAQV